MNNRQQNLSEIIAWLVGGVCLKKLSSFRKGPQYEYGFMANLPEVEQVLNHFTSKKECQSMHTLKAS